MSDIVDRLRNGQGIGINLTLCREAADEIERLRMQNATLREALREIADLHGEINPSNYDHDDACELNRQFCYALTVARAALEGK